MEVAEVVEFLALGIKRADARRPVGANKRSGLPYQAGVGPHTESETITLALAEVSNEMSVQVRREIPYPAAVRSRCDVVLDGPDPWAVEIKMLRLMGDNGKPNDSILMHILSPYPAHRSALTDCVKLLDSGFACRKGLVIFGYDYPGWPMDPAIEAFQSLASRTVTLGDVASASFDQLIHPVHVAGRVFGWELLGHGAHR